MVRAACFKCCGANLAAFLRELAASEEASFLAVLSTILSELSQCWLCVVYVPFVMISYCYALGSALLYGIQPWTLSIAVSIELRKAAPLLVPTLGLSIG